MTSSPALTTQKNLQATTTSTADEAIKTPRSVSSEKDKNVQVIEIEKLKAKLNQFSIQLAASTAHLIVKSNSPIITPSEKLISSQNVINITPKLYHFSSEDALLF